LSCVGCHESPNEAPRTSARKTLAMQAGPQELSEFYGTPRGFSYPAQIQPIWERHCVDCHNPQNENGKAAAFDLRATPVLDGRAKRYWAQSYLTLTQSGRPNRFVRWHNVQSAPPMLPPYSGGAIRSELPTMLEEGHYDVKLSVEERDKIACWIDLLVPYCGNYLEANAWTQEEVHKYEHFMRKRREMELLEEKNIAAFVADRK
jgi:hypothetical protein